MKLTGRQTTFLGQFLDLYQQNHQPIHYTTVADELGLGKITAYDMLRLLEEKGLVTSEYVLPEGERKRGRSTILYSPTEKASEVISGMHGEEWDPEGWERVKQRLLALLRKGRGTDYQEVLNGILQRIPRRRAPMFFAAETITAAVLNLYPVREEARAAGLFDYLRRMGRPGELGLSALSGLTMGLSLVEKANRHVTRRLLSYTHRYQESLSELNTAARQALADFAQDVLRVIDQ